MKTNIVEVSFTGRNFSAHLPSLPGCVSTAQTPEGIKENIQEAVRIHLDGMIEDGEKLPASFKGPYKLGFKFDAQSLLNYYQGIFTKAAMERITGINQRQLSHYASGLKSPRKVQRDKIRAGLRKLGEELSAIEL